MLRWEVKRNNHFGVTRSAEPELSDGAEASTAPPALTDRLLNVRTLVSFAVGFGILLFVVTRMQIDVNGIVERIRAANPWLLGLGVVSFYATFPVRAVRWRELLRNVGLGHDAKTSRVQLPVVGLSKIILVSWFANCIAPAKLGDAYRAYLLKLKYGVPFSSTMGTILAERMIDMLVLFTLMVLAAGLSFGPALPPEVLLLMQVGLVLAALVGAGLLGLRRLRPLVQRILPARLHAQYVQFEHGTLASFRRLPVVLALSLPAWASEVGRLYLVVLALGLGQVSLSVVLFVALASALATTLPLTPAGLGFAEGTITVLFLLAARIGLAPGVDEQTAAGIAVLDRVISYWSLIAVGLVMYPLTRHGQVAHRAHPHRSSAEQPQAAAA